jgi:hypothetical protein
VLVVVLLHHLQQAGLKAGEDFTVRRFDILCGKHGDHIGGERDAARALMAGEVEASEVGAWLEHAALHDDGIDRRPMTRLSPQFSSTLCRTHSQNFFDDTFSKESKDRCIFGGISVQAFNYNWRGYKHDIIQSNQSFE